ncbi:hypothetical protein [Streptomyces sp. MH60]|uniref:hypothetical protein n=1 Tax=Streptomyces sp. MH60 TaxID=1940758 RepID=UPI000CEF4148|nr:hypothetical protein [Streptomyces sp. MH60]PPS86453.1 hypothetical protein BZZ08_03420 [Streptomyces sp. MH60]
MGPEPFDFDEPEAARLRKAGERALWYALRHAGWSDTQIHNGLRTHRAGVLDEAAEMVANPALRTGMGWESAVKVLTSEAVRIREERTYGDSV